MNYLQPQIAARPVEADTRPAELVAFTLRAALGHMHALPERTSQCDPKCLGGTARTTAVLLRRLDKE